MNKSFDDEAQRAADPGEPALGGKFVTWLYGCYTWLVFLLVLALFGLLVAVLGNARLGRPLARAGARALFLFTTIPLSETGIASLPGRPHLLVINHTSFLDALALTALLPAFPGYAFTTRQQFKSQALLWPLLRGIATIVLAPHGDQHRQPNVDRLAKALQSGESLVVFPEGMFRPEAGLNCFHSGAFVAAAIAGAPVVVASISGAREALRLGCWMPRRKHIHIVIGPTLQPAGTTPPQLDALENDARGMMLEMINEPDLCPPGA